MQLTASVCQDVCDHLHNLCPLLFEQLEVYFSGTVTPEGVTMINCSDTGEYIAPLQHCCEDLDIDIRKQPPKKFHECHYCFLQHVQR